MLEELALIALLIGLFSALSLPLGTLTTLVWTPSERSIAWLMAFGAGALLYAVTLDLFAPALGSGHEWALILGAISGSLFYLGLNHVLNQQGGFLRKTATTLQYLKHLHRHQRQQFSLSLQRMTLWNDLPSDIQQALFEKMTLTTLNNNDILYHPGDCLNSFYVIESGHIKLRDPRIGLKTIVELKTKDSFGYYAFFSSLPSAVLAQSAGQARIWQIQRQDLNQLIQTFPLLQSRLSAFLEVSNTDLMAYLQTYQGLSHSAGARQLTFVQSHLSTESRLPSCREKREQFSAALHRLNHASRFSLLEHAPQELNSLIASKLKRRTVKAGATLFAHKSRADRLYLLESGELELIDPSLSSTQPETLSSGDFFGGKAFVLGGTHASTAIAKTDIDYWVLDKDDFIYISNQIPYLYERLQQYLTQNDITDYLVTEQSMPPSQANVWLNKNIKSLSPSHWPQLANNNLLHQHQAAYLAIWLGIFLDGIPESLMIGAHLANGQMISWSLIIAIFLSNYPEALSSSASMRNQGMKFSTVLWAWTSLMLLVGLGSMLGSVLLQNASEITVILISGMAAGAMLTVIAETMLPEAYLKGGSITGLMTLLGFLSAMLIKTIELNLAT